MGLGNDARTPFGLQIARFRARIAHDTTLDSFGRKFIGTLPANAQILAVGGGVKEAFNNSSPVLTVGTNGSTAANIVKAGGIDETAVAGIWVTTGAGLSFTEPVDVYAKFVNGTTASTSGIADLVVVYAPGEAGEIA